MSKNKKEEYRKMFETKGMRPYYSIPHIGIISKPFMDLVGFSYRAIDVTDADMHNGGYINVEDMSKATEYFRKFWKDEKKVKSLLKEVRNNFKKAEKAEKYGWQQNWKKKSDGDLIKDLNLFYNLMYDTMTRTIISQPQNVVSLEEEINKLLEKYSNREELLLAATFFEGELPWDDERRRIEILHSNWKNMSEKEKEEKLVKLVDDYGWFNEIEGNAPFDIAHYRKEVEDFKSENKFNLKIKVPLEVKKVGRLIGELGYLRFWSRYHFMALRYHLKKVLEEIVKRSKNPDLEFATIEEINSFFYGKKLDMKEIKARKEGYVTYLVNGKPIIVTGKKAEELKEAVREKVVELKEIKGSVANKGIVRGIARIISFVDKEYDSQVRAFKKGEILVTGMTRPQIVHLCQKAAAIVTDEGGITSHAAVVSREMKKPCIIATHNATKIIKTGDLVEVDANKGIVRILERN